MKSLQQWCCATLVGTGWTIANGLSSTAATPDFVVSKPSKNILAPHLNVARTSAILPPIALPPSTLTVASQPQPIAPLTDPVSTRSTTAKVTTLPIANPQVSAPPISRAQTATTQTVAFASTDFKETTLDELERASSTAPPRPTRTSQTLLPSMAQTQVPPHPRQSRSPFTVVSAAPQAPINPTKQSTDLAALQPVFTASHYLTQSHLTGSIAQTPTAPQTPQDFETPDSNRDRFLQPGEAAPQPFVPEADSLEEAAPALPQSDAVQPTPGEISVETLTVRGSSILSEAEIRELGQAYVGRSVSRESLQRLADAITEKYLERGYINSRAILNPQTLPTGQIEIQILEGGLEDIIVEGVQHLSTRYIRSRIALSAKTPLNTGALEDQLRLLRSSPLIDNIEASVRRGTQPAKSILVVRVTEAERFRASSSVDNYSPPSVGSERLSFSAGYQNLTGIGDDLSLGFKHTAQSGSDTLDFTYRVPLNPMEGTLQFRTSFNRNNVIQEPFSVLDIRGNSQLYELSFRQPLRRTTREEFVLSTGLTYQTGQTFTFAGGTPFGFGPEADGTTTTTVLKLGQDYIKRDPQGAWALRSQFSIGLDLLSPTINAGSIPDSRFVSWLGQIQRVQVLNENNFLLLSADLQLASEPLLSSQQFVIGGGQSVRGFRQNVRAGDGGLRFSVEDRLTLSRDEAGQATVILVPFFDMGWVWYDADNPNKPTDQQNFIAGTGLGVILTPFTGVTLRLDYAIPLVDLRDRTQNAQDDGIHFSVNVQI